MNEEEYDELFRYIRQLVIDSGRGDLDSRLLSSLELVEEPGSDVVTPGQIFRVDPGYAQRRLLRYLNGLRDDLALGSERAARETMRRFQSFRTDSGAPIRGITIDMTEADAKTYGTRHINLAGSPELDEIIDELNTYIADLRADEENR